MTEHKIEKKRDQRQERLLLFLFGLSIIIMTMVADHSLGTSAGQADGHTQTEALVAAPVEHTDWQRE
ncbi:hypothetical protein [Salicibibacter kimchii]|uniref:Uncharacterized protein n=1 Tax=Salicibibacter kimchii TaxID=2099786 RepID=A0A345BVP7_9BACI|nr:hypothetical protein [Salicibibacter kimchii]AXF55028.1 hypothetical protein DT065_02705 [Salicibibacter kimchii]